MLTGEWGCGKTYLLNTQLANCLKDTHILLRISLFGVMSVDEVKTEVRRKWLYAYTESKDTTGKVAAGLNKFGGSIKKFAEKAKEFLPDTAKNIVGGVLSINILDFVKIDPLIGEKKIVLIFDDLERARISTSDLLGCINDYCENLGFSTIIVANEEKIQDKDANSIKYDEIKEKIVERTVQHAPEYKSIVKSVIDDMKFKSDSYRFLLKEYNEEIMVIFSGETKDGKSLDELVDKCTKGGIYQESEEKNQRIHELLKKRPHNIRSLKCALQDFERVYDLLEEYEMPEINRWLFSFITYVFSTRAGLVKKNERYGFIFSENDVTKLYPGYYNDRYIADGIKAWIRDGEWDEETICYQMSFVKERYAAISPVQKARTNRIFELEENDLVDGYPELLNLAYEGNLELDDYVNLLWNSSWSRAYNINIPQIDWDRILLGVERKIDKLLQSHVEPSNHRTVIGAESRSGFIDSEWKVYELIEKYCEGELQIFENNRNLYIELMHKDPHKAYEEIRNKRLDCFSVEMAEVTLHAFTGALNAQKNDIVIYSKNIIRAMMNSGDFKAEQTEEALKDLKHGLESYLKQYCSGKNNSIAACHANYFIKTVDELLAELR